MRRIESDIPKSALSTIQRGTLQYRYKDVPCLKNPFDLALYLQLLWELKPRSVIEIGSAAGGSALWLADTLRRYRIAGHVYSADLNPPTDIDDDMVTFVTANALDLRERFDAGFLQSLERPLLVIEDAAHTFDVTLAVLRHFDSALRPGEYIIVEDGIVNDLAESEYRQFDNGPNRAILEFLSSTDGRFQIDERYCDFFGHNFTYCTNGFLRRTDRS